MRAYIASKFENQDQFHELREMLESYGHTVTRDWTKESIARSTEPGYITKCAEEDYSGVVEAEVLVLIPTKEPMAGAFVEFGIALGKGLDIIIVDPFNESYQKNIFYHLHNAFPWVMHAPDLSAAAELVHQLDYDRRQDALAFVSKELEKHAAKSS